MNSSRLFSYSVSYIYYVSVFFVSLAFFCPIVIGDDSGLNKALECFEGIKRSGRYPDDSDFFKISGDPEINLTGSEQIQLLLRLAEFQRGSISKDDISRLFELKRDSIHNADMRYDVKITGSSALKELVEVSYRFVFSKEKLYLSRRGHLAPNTSVNAYDGASLFLITEYDSDEPSASINSQISLGFFNCPHLPLTHAMLFDPRSRVDSAYENLSDIVDMLRDSTLTCVFENDYEVNGYSCIKISDLTRCFFLNPNKDFSVIRYELYAVESDSGGKIKRGSKPVYQSDLKNLRDYGNGIWIPTHIEQNLFISNTSWQRAYVEVASVLINQELPDSFFSDVIPENALVSDGKRGMVYRQSDHASINALLKEAAKSKRVRIFQYISVTLGIILILGNVLDLLF